MIDLLSDSHHFILCCLNIIYAYVCFITKMSHENLPYFVTFVSFFIILCHFVFGPPFERMEYGENNHLEVGVFPHLFPSSLDLSLNSPTFLVLLTV